MSRVLLIEDDLQMQKLIHDYLERFGFTCLSCATPKEALEILKKEHFDIIVLDLMLPQMDGFDLYKKIRDFCDTPVIISSARGDIGNKILGFELGAEDFLAKPYDPRELVLRIEAAMRRQGKSSRYEVGDFTVDEAQRTLFLKDYPIDLTKTEFDIFIVLAKNRGKALSRDQIIHAAGLDPDTRHKSIDMHISNIRHKIGDDPKNPRYIKSLWGIGYKLL
ncbi:MAG: DNA-binding response regulator [Epsilonproteobacteria bacterium]|nr:DNA-binding response regulator [Nitratiruptor sp.]MRJ02892.1 DNA-binding response regulator [Campylobacterota bacterium]NPA82985.1 response regulator transcription factor [Campylobacterota bacterium]